jgi:uncharacterized protein YigA (DUF484 family)
MNLNAEDVVRYLKEHQEFFENHAEMLTEIYLPHPHGGRAISLAERQQLALREKNKLLEDKLRELIQFGEENDALGEKVHRLSVGLLGARSLEDALNTVYFNLREDFTVPHVAMRLWGAVPESSLPEFSGVGIEVCSFADGLSGSRCGTETVEGVPGWFGEDGERLRSFAYVPLRGEEAFGLLTLASEDTQRFYPEMGTLYLNRIGELVSASLLHHLGG